MVAVSPISLTTTPAPTLQPVVGTLYLWSNSPFAYKVLMAAAYKGVRLDTRVAGFPDMMAAQKHTGKRKTPFVVATDPGGERWISDSTTICAWLEEQSGPSLLPTSAAARAECRLLEDWADEGLNKSAEPWIWVGGERLPMMLAFIVDDQEHKPSAWLMRALRPWIRSRWKGRVAGHGGLALTRELLCAQLDLIEARLDGAPWLFGETPSIADLSIAAQLANMVRFDCAADLDARPATSAMVRRACALISFPGAR